MWGSMSSDAHLSPSTDDGEELRPVGAEVKRLLRRGWWLITAGAAVGLAFGFMKLRGTEPTYLATARVYLSNAALPVVNETAQRLAAQQFDAQLTMPLAAIVSSEVIDATIQQNHLTEMRTFEGVADPARHLVTHLDVGDALPKRPDTPLLKFYGPDPKEAKAILASLIEAYRTYYVEWQHRRNETIIAALTGQRERFEAEYNEKQARRAQFQADHDATALGSHDLDVKLQQLDATATALNALKLKRIDTEVTLTWLQSTPRAESNRPIGLPESAAQHGAGAAPAAESLPLDRVARDYGPDHYLFRESQARREAQARNELRRVDDEAARLTEQIEALQASLDEQRQDVLAANRQVVDLKLIDNDIAGVEKLLAAIDRQVRDIQFLDEYGAAKITVLEPPYASSIPIAPDATRTVVVPVIVGCLIGLALAYWLTPEERGSFTTPSDAFSDSLGVPVLGVVRASSVAATLVPTVRPRRYGAPVGAEVRI